jgi:hypothetical protein
MIAGAAASVLQQFHPLTPEQLAAVVTLLSMLLVYFIPNSTPNGTKV